MQSSTWQLLRDDRVFADLVVYGGDFPWLNARVFPKEGFEEIRPIFERSYDLSMTTRTSRAGRTHTIAFAPR